MKIPPTSLPFTLLLGICAALPALSIDLSAPTLTILPQVLDTTVSAAVLTLSLFMVGFALGQFAGGRSSDHVGRRPVLLGSLIVYIIGGLCCAIATTGPQLVAARLAQGCGAGACAVQASAMVQDLFQGEAARRKQSYVSVVLTIMPMLAPALGTLLVAHWGWRSVHLVLAAAGLLLMAIIALLVAETRPASVRQVSRGLGFGDGAALLREAAFRRIVGVNALSYGAVFCYIAGAPVVVMSDLALPSAVYAALFAATALALSLGAMSNAALGRRGVTSLRLVRPALLGQAASTLILVAVGGRLHRGGEIVAIMALLLFAFTRGLLSPNFVHLAVSRHRDRAGLASALVGLMQLLVGALAGAFVAAMLARFGYSGVSVPMAVLACAATMTWWLSARAERVDVSNADERGGSSG